MSDYRNEHYNSFVSYIGLHIYLDYIHFYQTGNVYLFIYFFHKGSLPNEPHCINHFTQIYVCPILFSLMRIPLASFYEIQSKVFIYRSILAYYSSSLYLPLEQVLFEKTIRGMLFLLGKVLHACILKFYFYLPNN